MKICVLVNTLQSVNSFVYSNHIAFFVAAVKRRPDTEFLFFTPHRSSIDNARNQAAVMALQYECEYLMFIDDDVLVPPETLDKLLIADKDIIAALVIIRGHPFNVMAFKFDEKEPEEAKKGLLFLNDIPLIKVCGADHEKFELSCESCIRDGKLVELVQCDAVGFSCCLIKTDVLKPLEPPYFLTGRTHTEDIYFCMKIRDLEPRPEIWLHTGIRCGHLLNAEPIEWSNRALMKQIYESMMEEVPSDRRDEAYIEKCVASLR